MKPLLLILLYFVSVDVNYSDSYQKDAWKCLDNSYKTLLTDPKQSAAYSMQAYDILKQTTDSALIVYTLSMSGHAYMLYGNFDLSMNVYYKALSYCPEKDLKAKAKINLNLGTLYGSLKDFSMRLFRAFATSEELTPTLSTAAATMLWALKSSLFSLRSSTIRSIRYAVWI